MTIDVFGPANATDSTTSRPYDARIFTSADTYFKDCTNEDTDDGTDILAGWLNQITCNNRVLARANGLKTDGVNPVVVQDNGDDLLLRSIQALIQRGQIVFGTNSGTGDAAIVSLSPVPPELVTGMEILVFYGAANTTTTPVLNAGGTGNKNVVRQGGGQPALGDLLGFVPMVFDGTKWRVNGQVASDINPPPTVYTSGTAQSGQFYVMDLGVQQTFVVPNPATISAGWRCRLQVTGSPSGFQTASVAIAAGGGSTALTYYGLPHTPFYLAGGGEICELYYNGTNFYVWVPGQGGSYGLYRSNSGSTQPGGGTLSQLTFSAIGGNTTQFAAGVSAGTITMPYSGLWLIEAKLSAISASSSYFQASLYLASDSVLTQIFDTASNSQNNNAAVNLSVSLPILLKQGQTFCATSMIPSGMNWLTGGNTQSVTLLRR